MESFRVRRGEVERRVPDRLSLLAMARSGDLRGDDEIATAEGWVRAAIHPAVKAVLSTSGGDPWAAWSALDEVDAASLYKQMMEAEPEEIPSDALTPVGGVIDAASAGLVSLEAGALEPFDESPELAPDPSTDETSRPALSLRDAPQRRPGGDVRAALGASPEGGELIDFPRPKPLPRVELPRLDRRPVNPGPPPLVRGTRVFTMVIGGLFLLLLGYTWVSMNAQSRSGVGIPSPERSRPVEATALSPLQRIDNEVHGQLSPTPRLVAKNGDLSDALLIELTQMRIDVLLADGRVTKWIGRKGDEPRVAEVRIQYRSGGELSRELGAIALVVGRYKRLYRLDIPVFEVTEVGARGLSRIDAERAEAYYLTRIDLEQFLESIASN